MSPNQPKTPARSVRIDDETWERVKRAAAAVGVDASEWLRRAADEQLGREGF